MAKIQESEIAWIVDGEKADAINTNRPLKEVLSKLGELSVLDIVSTNQIADNSIGNDKLVNNSIDGSKLLNNSVPASKLMNSSIDGNNIIIGTTNGDRLIDNTVSGVKLINNSVDGSKLIDNSLDGFKILDESITINKLADESIPESKLADGSISTVKLIDNAVTTVKVSNLNITTEKLANGSVTTEKLASAIQSRLNTLDARVDAANDLANAANAAAAGAQSAANNASNNAANAGSDSLKLSGGTMTGSITNLRTNDESICLGSGATASGSSSVAIGKGASATQNGSTSLGTNAAVTAANQVQLGGSGTSTYAYGAVQDRSDMRDKVDIDELDLGIDFLCSLKPKKYRFDYRDDYFNRDNKFPDREDFETQEEYELALSDYQEKRKDFFKNPIKDGSLKRNRFHSGLIAQELEQTCKELGVDFSGLQHHEYQGGSDVYTIGYQEFIPILIKSIQELKEEIEVLKSKTNRKVSKK